MGKKTGCYTFPCLRRFLTLFNFLLFAFGLLVATLPIYFQIHQMVQSWPINGGIIAMGTFLVLLALIGCYGSFRQDQIVLFFYMVMLSLVCILTFAFSLSALSLTRSQQNKILSKGWRNLSTKTKMEIQKWGNCCGFQNSTSLAVEDHPPCGELPCFHSSNGCTTCKKKIIDNGFVGFRQAVGGVALFVSLLMAVSIYLTARYRHIKNPTANPNEFL